MNEISHKDDPRAVRQMFYMLGSVAIAVWLLLVFIMPMVAGAEVATPGMRLVRIGRAIGWWFLAVNALIVILGLAYQAWNPSERKMDEHAKKVLEGAGYHLVLVSGYSQPSGADSYAIHAIADAPDGKTVSCIVTGRRGASPEIQVERTL